ncbi:hypothetical protein M427DRAFT_158190 [Gonapodya prolifera JEL478]|uniref:F-box domain-containing protein n=1 Tax=Gonapodya prolifera (strain JEL478) TaxID=1344416 RepID=A0A139A3Q9_GONPJ|nr:hypothetical protein M427DRAFT_158190 [Gonapodya prolifera JEL478]|eukprot:KXS11432.1 hypothetical protein M427DRAFT_158190 [Gonapodya prolifera JEL478]
MDSLPYELLYRVLAFLNHRQAFFTHIPLVCWRFRAIQVEILKASSVDVDISLDTNASTANMYGTWFRLTDLQTLLANDAPSGEGIVTPPALCKRVFQSCFVHQPDPWIETHITGFLNLCGSDSKTSLPGAMADVVKRALTACSPFGHHAIQRITFRTVVSISWAVDFGNTMGASSVDLPHWVDNADGTKRAWDRSDEEALSLLNASHVVLHRKNLSTLFLLPNARSIQFSPVQIMGPDISWSSDHGGPKVHPKLEILDLGSPFPMSASGIEELSRVIQKGRLPRLCRIDALYTAGGVAFDTENPTDPLVNRVNALRRLAAACQSVKVRFRCSSDHAFDYFQQQYGATCGESQIDSRMEVINLSQSTQAV